MTGPDTPPAAPEITWEQVWDAVCTELRRYHDVGLRHLLTEDVVRFATVRMLVGHGVPARELRTEWATPELKGGHVDLVVSQPPSTAVEFKYPRERVRENAAWTQTLGEVMKDFYRLAVLPPSVTTRICVFVSSSDLRKYLAGVKAKHGLDLFADPVEFSPAMVAGLPKTVRGIIGDWASTITVVADNRTTITVDDDLWLTAYAIESVSPSLHGPTAPEERQGVTPTFAQS